MGRKALVRFCSKPFLRLVENRGFRVLRFLLVSVSPVSSFEPTSKNIKTTEKWRSALNAVLPDDIVVKSVQTV